ncbi:hypothetical protein CG478_011015 [Bacillus cytotoxicus]|nr:hypothetical protein CG483_004240 [Bacillus cytotoxicus]AWC40957.1 hypothetical protein CG480_011015 [Bacillus cytotoxicus]AWC43752.1 hypothetical protein CG479_003930 [Bacillus cytotoxicus]AWC48888.1 hypothetical protein CG478_011015 [Bacillus cytotoxicus]AWC51734.1 hypothetical protein CG477_004235 [Bacillus cytotoxicus]
MKKFLVSYAYSVLSLLIIINIIQQYNYVLLEGKSKYNIFIDVYVNTIQATLAACILGAPMVLFGCILGELLFRYIILLNKYNFIFSVIIYIFLGSGLISIFLYLGYPTSYEYLTTMDIAQYMLMTSICSVTFFMSRNRYEKRNCPKSSFK